MFTPNAVVENNTMSLSNSVKTEINELKKKYDFLKKDKEHILNSIYLYEIPESVYNSNAIENSTLNVKETKEIISRQNILRMVTKREIHEAINLAKVLVYIKDKAGVKELDKELILHLHHMLMGSINKKIAGRFRKQDENIYLGTHTATAPEYIENTINTMLKQYSSSKRYFLEKIAEFHAEFEHTHPFFDGNGRIGRILVDYHLIQLGYPPVIIRFSDMSDYIAALRTFSINRKTGPIEEILSLALIESLNKRIAYMSSDHN